MVISLPGRKIPVGFCFKIKSQQCQSLRNYIRWIRTMKYGENVNVVMKRISGCSGRAPSVEPSYLNQKNVKQILKFMNSELIEFHITQNGKLMDGSGRVSIPECYINAISYMDAVRILNDFLSTKVIPGEMKLITPLEQIAFDK